MFIKRWSLFVLCLCLSLSSSYGGPNAGVGLYGVTSNLQMASSTAPQSINQGNFSGLGFDYQWSLSPSWSLDIGYYEIAVSAFTTEVPQATVAKTTSLWSRAKLWFGPIYLSLRTGQQFLVLANSAFTGTVSGNQTLPASFGLGLESDGGWLLDLQFTNLKNVHTNQADFDLNAKGTTLFVGWRWD